MKQFPPPHSTLPHQAVRSIPLQNLHLHHRWWPSHFAQQRYQTVSIGLLLVLCTVCATTLFATQPRLSERWNMRNHPIADGKAAIALTKAENFIPIYSIQGSGLQTPYFQQWIDTYGVVTAVLNDGFYLQDPIGDNDPMTSDGIFVYTRTAPDLRPGQCVEVQRAYVDEFYEKTELSRTTTIIPTTICSTLTVTPVTIPTTTLTQEPSSLFERFEGMVVELSAVEGIVQGPTKHFADGEMEVAMLAKEHLPYLDGGRLFQTNTEVMNALHYLSNALDATLPEVRWGDTLILGDPESTAPSVRAILDYNFGKYQLLLWPGTAITSRRFTTALPPLDVAQPMTDEDFSLCTYNLHGMGRGSEQYWEPKEYDRQLAKRARTIVDSLAGCTIIGLQEAGAPEDIERLAALLQSAFVIDYAPVALPGPNSQSNEYPLTNGLIARRERVQIDRAETSQGCSAADYEVARLADDCPPGTFPLFNRPPLIVDMRVQGAWGQPFAITVIVNHWKSKGGDERINVVRRTAQAAHVATIVQARLTIDPTTNLVVLGDLNDYYSSGPIDTVRTGAEPPLHHPYDHLAPLDRYSYIFNGGSQVLDHILVTTNLQPLLARIDPIHVNADYPAGDNAQVALLQQSSDHDPVLLQIRPAGVGILGGNLGFPGIKLTLLQRSMAEATQEQKESEGHGNTETALNREATLIATDEANLSDAPIIAETVTDALGDFRFWAITPGEHYLHIDAPAHFSQSAQAGILSIEPGYQTLVVQPWLAADSTDVGEIVVDTLAVQSNDMQSNDVRIIHQDIEDAVMLLYTTPFLLRQIVSDTDAQNADAQKDK